MCKVIGRFKNAARIIPLERIKTNSKIRKTTPVYREYSTISQSRLFD
ncbi:MAG: hypothetical protein ACP5P3_06250 [Ignavibacteria bacterium]